MNMTTDRFGCGRKREGISNRRVTYVAQKPYVSEHVANRFLDSFMTSVVAYKFTDRNVVNIDEVRYHGTIDVRKRVRVYFFNILMS